jgi:predicted nucleic acid-binding protein
MPVRTLFVSLCLSGRFLTRFWARIRTLLSGFAVVGVDERIAGQAVVLKRRRGIKTPDAIIAATAMIENACLVTRDQNLLEKVPEVRSLNPFGRNP